MGLVKDLIIEVLKSGKSIQGIDQVMRGYEYELVLIDGEVKVYMNSLGDSILDYDEEMIFLESIDWTVLPEPTKSLKMKLEELANE